MAVRLRIEMRQSYCNGFLTCCTMRRRSLRLLYSDVGFIFLMIDFQDENHPLIQVRTWQPEKLNGRVLSRDEVFSLGNFDIVRSLIND